MTTCLSHADVLLSPFISFPGFKLLDDPVNSSTQCYQPVLWKVNDFLNFINLNSSILSWMLTVFVVSTVWFSLMKLLLALRLILLDRMLFMHRLMVFEEWFIIDGWLGMVNMCTMLFSLISYRVFMMNVMMTMVLLMILIFLWIFFCFPTVNKALKIAVLPH